MEYIKPKLEGEVPILTISSKFPTCFFKFSKDLLRSYKFIKKYALAKKNCIIYFDFPEYFPEEITTINEGIFDLLKYMKKRRKKSNIYLINYPDHHLEILAGDGLLNIEGISLEKNIESSIQKIWKQQV